MLGSKSVNKLFWPGNFSRGGTLSSMNMRLATLPRLGVEFHTQDRYAGRFVPSNNLTLRATMILLVLFHHVHFQVPFLAMTSPTGAMLYLQRNAGRFSVTVLQFS
jgi:hypothetical protein